MAYMESDIAASVNCDACLPRCLSGSSPIMGIFTNNAATKQVIGLTPNFPAKVIPLAMSGPKGPIVYMCKKGAFFANIGQAKLDFDLDFNPQTCLFGGQGCVRQKVEGEGTAFLAAMGTIMTKTLAEGETIVVDTNSVVAWENTATLDIRRAGGLGTCLCGGEGLFNTTLTGPGQVFFQSMSFEKFRSALQIQVAQQGAAQGGAFGAAAALTGGPPEAAMEMQR